MSLKVVAALLVLVTSASAKAPLLAAESKTIIPGEYIVVLDERLTDKEAEAHKSSVRSAMQLSGNTSHIHSEWRIGKGFLGYSVHGDEKIVETIRDMSVVKYVEYNQEVHAVQECTDQNSAVWGLHRTVVRDKTTGGAQYYEYSEDHAGQGVDVYIIDTGIYTSNVEFGGRAVFGHNTVDNRDTDGNGHGTHVAGTVIGNKYGLARKATAIAVRVLNDNGSGSTTGVISGVSWVANQHSSGKKSVANMSLGGGYSTSMNAAVDAAVDKGVHFAVAAGNENQDACSRSPASSQKCVTVGATDSGDVRSYFSNYGTCVQIFAPGSDITSAWIGSTSAVNTISGTSMASPHVAGVMAKILTRESLTPEEMKQKLQNTATTGKITNVGSGSPNYLLFNECPVVV